MGERECPSDTEVESRVTRRYTYFAERINLLSIVASDSNDNPVRSEAVDDNVLDASTGDDGALGGGINVMLDGLRVASTRDVGVAIATNCQRRIRRHEVRRLFNHYMGVIVMFC